MGFSLQKARTNWHEPLLRYHQQQQQEGHSCSLVHLHFTHLLFLIRSMLSAKHISVISIAVCCSEAVCQPQVGTRSTRRTERGVGTERCQGSKWGVKGC